MTTRSAGVAAVVFAIAAVIGCGGSPPAGPTPVQPTPQPQPNPEPQPQPQPQPTPPRLNVTRILSFGDSLTAGTTAPPVSLRFALDGGRAESYPFKLQTAAAARYTDQTIEVFNAGIPGRQAAEDRDRFARSLRDASPQVVLLLEGANDLNRPLDPGEGMNDRIAATVGALEDMVRDAARAQVPVFIATLPPQRLDGRRAGAAELVARFNEGIRSMARAKGATVVDLATLLTLNDVGNDGLHLTDGGYQHMADVWLEALKAKYETAAGQ